MNKTFEDYIISQLEEPVTLKDGSKAVDANGNILTKDQAIATNLINKAMKGDIPSIQYIQNIKALNSKKQKK